MSMKLRVKIVLLVILGISTLGLRRTSAEEACGPTSCARVMENGNPVGYGCVAEGSVNRKCTATLSGCTFDSCPGYSD